jgi:glycosyltransferase involved in cell wall biosynthesis
MVPRVSVVIPSYNRAGCIEKAIDSVLEQTVDDIEIILVDDGSTDNTRELVQNKYGDQVRYVYQENQGMAGARNTGIKNAQGDYIAFLDSDDYWRPGKLERQLSLAEEHPEYGLLASRCDKIQRSGHINKPNRPLSYQSRRGKSGWVLNDLFQANFIRTSTVIIRRDCFNRIGLFDEKLIRGEDIDFWLRMASVYPIGFINESLTVYLDNPDGVSTDSLLARLYRTIVFEKDYLKKRIPKSLYNRRMAMNYNKIGRHYLQRGDREKGLAYLKKARNLAPFCLKYTVYFIKGLFTRHKASLDFSI